MFARSYAKLGSRYPLRFLGLALRAEYLVVAAGAAGLSLYVSMSIPDLLLIAGAAIVGQEFYAQLTLRYFRPRLEPVERWIEGAHTEATAAEAWQAAASAPYQL